MALVSHPWYLIYNLYCKLKIFPKKLIHATMWITEILLYIFWAICIWSHTHMVSLLNQISQLHQLFCWWKWRISSSIKDILKGLEWFSWCQGIFPPPHYTHLHISPIQITHSYISLCAHIWPCLLTPGLEYIFWLSIKAYNGYSDNRRQQH